MYIMCVCVCVCVCIILFIFVCVVPLLLCRVSSSCSEQGYPLGGVCRLLIAWLPVLQSTGSRVLRVN